jgi:hypothetical protein
MSMLAISGPATCMAAKLSDTVGRGNALTLLGQDRTKRSKHARAIHKMIGHTGTRLMEGRMFSLAGGDRSFRGNARDRDRRNVSGNAAELVTTP